jgi:naphthalene 1,2-dioxygenase system ferredoxin subunit
MTHTVARASDIPPGSMRRVVANGHALVVYNVDGALYATDDACTHRRARLSDGFLEGRVVQCPLHFGRFDVITGQPLNAPCTIALATYAVAIEGENVVVETADVPA